MYSNSRENETAYFLQWLPAMQIAFDGQQKQQNLHVHVDNLYIEHIV
jgi:hypothetical protein